jgi:probable rRNA maturation factor
MEILIRNRQRKIKADLNSLRQAAEKVLRILGLPQAELSITLVNDKQIRLLNREYRNINKPTDVLAFPMQEGEFKGLNPNLLGDIVISLETASKQALSIGHSLTKELDQLLIHGILHLLNYDHSRTMVRKEQELLQLVAK